ncbi:hypothetical protein JCM11251_005195 [Rhodosporidiobolus azoricus]
MTTLFCPDCGTNTLFESDPRSGTLACTVCGTVSAASTSQAFEYLARVDEEDAFQGGRTYVGKQGVRRSGRVEGWARGAGESSRVYHQKKKGDFDAFVRRLMGRFQLTSLRDRIFNMCENAKRLIQFRWGRRAEIFAAACVYVAAREQNRSLWLFDMADAVDIKDIYTLTRAIRIVKFELQINTPETEPALYVEKILVHLNILFSQPKPILHGSSTKGKKTWSASNVKWVRALSLPQVRELATGLLSFADSTSLVAGRAPEQVASACILVALEGVARRPVPVGQEFCDELAHLLGGKAFTIQERYREFNKLLADYAPQLPFLANEEFAIPGEKVKAFNKGKTGRGSAKGIKKDLVQFTADIVQFRQAIEAGKAKAKREAETEREAKEAEIGKGKERAIEEEEAASTFTGNVVFDEDEGEEEAEEEDGEDPTNHLLHDDPLASVNASNAFLDDAAFALPRPSELPRPRKVFTLNDAVGSRPSPLEEGKKRPAEYVRNVGRPNKRLKVIEDIAGRLATEASASSTAQSPSPAPEPRRSPSATRSRSPSAPATSSLSSRPVHDDENHRIRQLLLAGHDPATIYAHLHTPSSMEARSIPEPPKPATRLGRLLWDKTADELDDEELFDADELDSYVRSAAEVKHFLHLPQTQEMLRIAEEQERARAGRPPRRPTTRKRRRFFARYYPQHDDPSDAPEEVAKVAGGSRRRSEREDTTETTDSFAPRKKKTKLKPEAKARIEALLAMEGIGDDEEDDYGRGGGKGQGGKGDSPVGQDEWRLEFALDAARDEGEDVHDDDADDAPSPARGRTGGGGDEEEEDWRTALGYGGQQEDEEDGGYDD